ncbi:hypothetical protein E3N88_34331 [Mikania micrantha]|uniref:DUF4371 domain-containing protein n=1 Tax=Mikania micrantha TaxID=192012 RepID=A0A5N6LY37_9ASTR|nr:hypothetical protein E3N88_34331 [Mikania micrantha]
MQSTKDVIMKGNDFTKTKKISDKNCQKNSTVCDFSTNSLKNTLLISEMNPEIGKYTLGNAKKNNKSTSPSIQKEIIDCFAKEVIKRICDEVKDNVFGLLVDESSDVSLKEQMAVVLRYVDKLGVVKESFIGIAHVKDTSSSSLKQAIVSMLANNQLSISQVSIKFVS